VNADTENRTEEALVIKGGRGVFDQSRSMILHHSAEVACVEKERLVDPKVRQAMEVSGDRWGIGVTRR
jgi:hypothetical protein